MALGGDFSCKFLRPTPSVSSPFNEGRNRTRFVYKERVSHSYMREKTARFATGDLVKGVPVFIKF